jgi:hypothetical protein
MSLYLTVFHGKNEIVGWVLGHYSDFGYFREKVAEVADQGQYPTLMTHSDCDGAWQVDELERLKIELRSIGQIFQDLPAEEPSGAFEHTAEYRRGAKSLYECFHNVDGENLFEALLALCDEGLHHREPILFQ